MPLVASLSRGLYPLATGSAAAALSCQRDQTALIGEMTNIDLAIDSVFSASSGKAVQQRPPALSLRAILSSCSIYTA